MPCVQCNGSWECGPDESMLCEEEVADKSTVTKSKWKCYGRPRTYEKGTYYAFVSCQDGAKPCQPRIDTEPDSFCGEVALGKIDLTAAGVYQLCCRYVDGQPEFQFKDKS